LCFATDALKVEDAAAALLTGCPTGVVRRLRLCSACTGSPLAEVRVVLAHYDLPVDVEVEATMTLVMRDATGGVL
jgi:hypothetical protein